MRFRPHPTSNQTCRLFLTEQVDSQGRTNTFQYTTNNWVIYLKTFADYDGRTNTLLYDTNASWPTFVLGVSNWFGAVVSFKYDQYRLLTNIVDVIGTSSSFKYLDTNGVTVITNMSTPYGPVRFEYIVPGGELFDQTSYTNINRAIKVFEPNGARHLFMYRDDTCATPPAVWLPSSYDDAPPDVCNANMCFRNSLYWGPRQYDRLSTEELRNFSNADYNLARLRNWLHDRPAYNHDSLSLAPRVTQTLNMQRDLSPDGVALGQKTWLAYENAEGFYTSEFRGTKITPTYLAWKLPNGDTNYVRRMLNLYGRTTNEVSTYSTSSGTGYRTNNYIYAPDHVDLLAMYDAENREIQTNGYNARHQVTATKNAAGEVISYTYDSDRRFTGARYPRLPSGLTLTNFYYSSGTHKGYLEKTVLIELAHTNSYTYSNGWVLTHTDERGLTRTYLHDALGRVLSITFADEANTTISNRYDKLDLVATKDRLGNWTYFGYDSARHLTSVTNAAGGVTSYQYCGCGSLDSMTDATGTNTTLFYYDDAGRLISVHYPDGTWVTNDYNLLGQRTKTMDSAGANATNYFNNQGLLIASSNAFGQVFRSRYDIHDDLVNYTDSNGLSVTNTYNKDHRVRVKAYSDGSNEGFYYYYGYFGGELSFYTNRATKVTKYGHDVAARKVAETNGNGEVIQFEYYPSGDLFRLTDGKNQVTSWAYDINGLVSHKTNHVGELVLAYKYDANGRLTNRWSAAKGDTHYQYDVVGNLTVVNYPNSSDVALQYDALNQVTNLVDAVGVNRYIYDRMGQVLSEDGPWENDAVNYLYTNRLRSTLNVPLAGFGAQTWNYGYDAAKRLATISGSGGQFTYGYHTGLVGNVSPSRLVQNLSLPNSGNISNQFDSGARTLSTLLNGNGGATLNVHGYGYNAAGQRTNETRYDDSYVDYTYDAAGQLRTGKGYDEGVSRSRMHEQFGYAYDAAGNLTHRTNNVLVQTFTVNGLNQLTNVTRSGTLTVAGIVTGTATNVLVEELPADVYSDNTFARTNLSLADGTNTFTAEAHGYLGRIATDTTKVYLPATVGYLFDANGNLLTDGRRYFEWDDENQLISVVLTNSTKSTFSYDGKMRRRLRKEYIWQNSAWRQTEEVRYLYDGNLVAQERHYDPRVTMAQPQRIVTYSRGLDLSGTLEGAGGIAGLLARTEFVPATLASSTAYYHSDGNGNVTALLDENQNLVARYLYDPFGNVIAKSGSLAEANAYRFSSKEWHEPSGLVYYLYRFYEPNLQRWINRDPINEPGFETVADLRTLPSSREPNGYVFGANSPLNTYDAFGLLLAPPPPVAICHPVGISILVGGVLIYYVVNLCTPNPDPDPGPQCNFKTRYQMDLEDCIDECSDKALPGKRFQHGARFYRCLRDCMEDRGWTGVPY